VKSLLPSRENLLRERVVVSRNLSMSSLSETGKPITGPLLPSGKFRVKDSGTIRDGFRDPKRIDWKVLPYKSKTEPVRLAAIHLSPKVSRCISKGPSRKFRKSLPSGPYLVDPDRTCVSNFKRRMHALDEANSLLEWLGSEIYSLGSLKPLRDILHLYPEFLWNVDDSPNSYNRKVMNCLWFSFRKLRGTGQQFRQRRTERSSS
jgi:hypothetical protein